MADKIKLKLCTGAYGFFVSPYNFTRYSPEYEVDELTPALQHGIDAGFIEIDKPAKPIPAAQIEDRPVYRKGDGQFTDDPTEDADGKPEVFKKKVKRPTQNKKCKGKTSAGNKCMKKALKHSDFCSFHTPEEDLAEIDNKLAEEKA